MILWKSVDGRELGPGEAASLSRLTLGIAANEAVAAGRLDEAAAWTNLELPDSRRYSVYCKSLQSIHSCAQKSVK